MRSGRIIVSAYDYMRLRAYATPGTAGNGTNYLKKKLAAVLNGADIVSPWEIPADVVTMNSKVQLKDRRTQERLVFSLVFPLDADSGRNRLSILTPLGVSLLGCKTGQQIETRIEVKQVVYQPEAAGHFHL